MLQGAHVCSIECQSVCDFLMVTAVMKRPFPFFCLISNFKSAFRNLLELFASHLSKHGTNKTSDDPPICSRAERENSGGGSQWPSSWRTGTWPPHWRGQCAPCNANVTATAASRFVNLTIRKSNCIWHCDDIQYCQRYASGGLVTYVTEQKMPSNGKQCLGRSCMLAPKLICTYPFPVLYAFVRTGVLSIALLTLTNPKNIGNSQKTKKTTSLVLIPGSIHFLDPTYSIVHWSHCYHIPELHWILQSKCQTEGSVPSASQIKWPREPWAATWATVEGVLMGAVFRGRSTLQAEFLNPWASQLEQSYCALQGLLDLNRKHLKKYEVPSRFPC